jgi:hypothetical protein
VSRSVVMVCESTLKAVGVTGSLAQSFGAGLSVVLSI